MSWVIIFIAGICAFIYGAINLEAEVLPFCIVILLITLSMTLMCTVVPINQIAHNIAILKGKATRNDSVWWEED